MMPVESSESIRKRKDHCSQKGRRTHPKATKKRHAALLLGTDALPSRVYSVIA